MLLIAPTSLLHAQSDKPGRANPPAVQRKQPGQASSRQVDESIKGRVVGEGNRPVPGASVLAFPVNLTNNQALITSLMRPGISDAEGKFELVGLSPGAYTMTANSPGYVLSESDSSPFHRPGETVTLTLVKGGVITGKVTNSSGEPLVGAAVRTIKIREPDNKPVRARGGMHAEFVDATTAFLGGFKTDDRGIYRIFGLRPGDYQVAAGGRGGAGFAIGEGAYDADAPTYFPSSTIDTAAEVKVRAGEEVTGIDIRYRDLRGHSISGHLSGSNSSIQQSCSILLTRANGGTLEATTYVLPLANEKGFAFNAVLDGEYFVAAMGSNAPGISLGATPDVLVSQPKRVTMNGADVTGIELALEPLASITGRAVIERLPNAAPKPECKDARNPKVEEVVISARTQNKPRPEDSAYGSLSTPRDTAPTDTGEFTLALLRAGVHRIDLQLLSETVYFKSATSPPGSSENKPVDVAKNGIPLKSGDKLNGVIVTISEGAAGLRGKVVTGEDNKPPEVKMRVHLVPAEPEAADVVLRYFETSVSGDGGFALANLAPGKYWLVAREIAEGDPAETRQTPVAWEAGGRMGLRFEGDATKKVIELGPCQRLADFVLSYKPLVKPSTPSKKGTGSAAGLSR